MRQQDANHLIDQGIDIGLAHQLVFLLHDPDLQQFGLRLDVISISLIRGDCRLSRRKYCS
jgi:hypothetical protein